MQNPLVEQWISPALQSGPWMMLNILETSGEAGPGTDVRVKPNSSWAGDGRQLNHHVQMARDLQQHGSGPGPGTDVKPARAGG